MCTTGPNRTIVVYPQTWSCTDGTDHRSKKVMDPLGGIVSGRVSIRFPKLFYPDPRSRSLYYLVVIQKYFTHVYPRTYLVVTPKYIPHVYHMNTELYNKVKTAIKKAYPVHSAYRSGLIVRTYKRLGGVYPGKKPTRTGLVRWFKEDWKSNTGKYGYTSKSSVYRPTKRVTKNTPKTFSELTPKELLRAKREKSRTGHVKKF